MFEFCEFKIMANINKYLSEIDVSGQEIKSWAKVCPSDTSALYCICCEKQVKIIRGKFSVSQHVRSTHHQQQFKIKIQDQLHLKNDKSAGGLSLFTPKQDAVKAELMWSLRLLGKNQSFESVNGLKELLECTFPNVEWLQYFSLSPRKLSYITTYALAPYFQGKLIEDVEGI